MDDEHIRNALASPLHILERGGKCEPVASLPLLMMKACVPGAQAILASKGKPVARLSKKRKSSQEFDDDRIRNLLEQKERLLSESKIRNPGIRVWS